MKADRSLDYYVKASWHAISRMYNAIAEQHGVTISMAYVLLILDEVNGVPSTQIAPSIGMEPSSLTRLLKSMEDKGFIIRTQDKIDKRQVLVYLTPEGKNRQREAKRAIREFDNQLKNNIAQEDINTFLSVLEQINVLAEKNRLKEKS